MTEETKKQKPVAVLLVKFSRTIAELNRFNQIKEKMESYPLFDVYVWDNDSCNIGLVKARVEWLRDITHDFIVFMDFDVDILHLDFVSMVAKASHEDVGVVFPSNRPAQHCFDKDEWTADRAVPCNFMMMEREKLIKIGGLHPGYNTAYADWDMLNKFEAMGFKHYRHSHSLVLHDGFSQNNPEKRGIWNSDYKLYRKRGNKDRPRPGV